MNYECKGCQKDGVDHTPCHITVSDSATWAPMYCPLFGAASVDWKPMSGLDTRIVPKDAQEDLLLRVIWEHGGNQRAVARALGCSKATVYRRVNQSPALRRAVREAVYIKDLNRELAGEPSSPEESEEINTDPVIPEEVDVVR